VGEKPETNGYFVSGQTWTLPDACEITLDVYPPNQWRADRASSAATNHALQLGATDLEYEVTRVKSPVIGRDMNPMGRGDGTYYCNGGNLANGASLAIRGAKPVFTGVGTWGCGSSMNNPSDDLSPPPMQDEKSCCCGLIDCWKCPTIESPIGPEGPDPTKIPFLDYCCEALKTWQTRDDCPPDTGWGYSGADWDAYCADEWAHPPTKPWGDWDEPDSYGKGIQCSAQHRRGILDAMWQAAECVRKIGGKVLGSRIASCVLRVLEGWGFLCQDQWEEACCIGVSGNVQCCNVNVDAISCMWPPDRPGGSSTRGYILFCHKFLNPDYMGDYPTRFCYKMQVILHEALHLCGVRHGSLKETTYNDLYADALLCRCFCGCFEMEDRKKACKVITEESLK